MRNKMPLDDIENAVDKVASPERVTKWIVRIVLLFVLVGTAFTVGRLCFHWLDKVDAATIDRSWFTTQYESIQATELEIKAAHDALARHEAEVASRSGTFSISRSEDRVESRRLNQVILDVQRKRLGLVRDYNARAAEVSDQGFLAGLPGHIDLGQPE
jgi:multidrug efflux pump subunit AcrB